jgi:hypothetical protein
MALVSGVIVLLGVQRGGRARGAWFFLTGASIALWCTSGTLFSMSTPGQEALAILYTKITFALALVLSICLFSYNCWVNRTGKIATLIVLLIGGALIIQFVLSPSLLFTGITLSNTVNNSITNADSWFVPTFFGFTGIVNIGYLVALIMQYKTATDRNAKKGLQISLIGWSICTALLFTFLMALPSTGNYNFVWVGPLSFGVVLIAVYYSMLRYRLLVLRSNFLSIVSYAMIFIIATMVYMVLFFVVFTSLFKIPNPSMSVLALNVVMVAIVLLLLPVISEVGAAIKSMIFVRSVDMVYIVKKINHLAGQKIDLKNLAEFLADRMHFEYVGFLIDGRLWGSSKIDLADNELAKIAKMQHSSSYIWLYVDDTLRPVFERSGLAAVAQMRNARGQVFGHILIGRPIGEIKFEQRDLTQVESIINLVAAVVNSSEKKVCINVNGQRICGVPASEAKKIAGDH